MKNAFLFPGQGSLEIGMGKDLYDSLPAAKEILDRACDITKYDLKKIMFEGPYEQLINTQYAQPIVYTCSAMHLEKSKELGINYEYVAGHSLGEYSALYAAGIVSFETGVLLVKKRGMAMSVGNGKGLMAAVLGLTEEGLKDFLPSDVVMANLNSKTQIVISGTQEGIDEVENRLKSMSDMDEIKFRRLSVSGAFHSPQMSVAAEMMKKEIEEAEMIESNCHIVSNVSGKVATSLEEIKINLIEQITGQVRWYDSILLLKELGVEQFYEIGHGDVLRRMNKGIILRPRCLSI